MTPTTPRLTALTERLNDGSTSDIVKRWPPGTRERHALELVYWHGAAAVLETLATHCDEFGELLDVAGLLYDETCEAITRLHDNPASGIPYGGPNQ